MLVGYSKGAGHPQSRGSLPRDPWPHRRDLECGRRRGRLRTGKRRGAGAGKAAAALARCKVDKGDGGANAVADGARGDGAEVRLRRARELVGTDVMARLLCDRVSRLIEKSYKTLGAIDWRNDSQVIYSDEIIPGSTLLGFLNCDHWAIAVPLNRSHPVISRSLVNKNDYPREALLEAVLRFIEEDLSAGGGEDRT